MQGVTVVDHPLVQHKLSLMRRKETPTAMFRQLIREITLLLGYEVTRDLPMGKERIETPITEMDAPVLTGKKLVFISVLRAGNGLLDAHIGRIAQNTPNCGYIPTDTPFGRWHLVVTEFFGLSMHGFEGADRLVFKPSFCFS